MQRIFKFYKILTGFHRTGAIFIRCLSTRRNVEYPFRFSVLGSGGRGTSKSLLLEFDRNSPDSHRYGFYLTKKTEKNNTDRRITVYSMMPMIFPPVTAPNMFENRKNQTDNILFIFPTIKCPINVTFYFTTGVKNDRNLAAIT